MDVWIDFAQNCTQLKELHLYSGSGDWFNFNEEAFSKLLKIQTLEILIVKKLELPFWPKGPSNLKRIELIGISEKGDANTLVQYQNNFHTHQKVMEISITTGNLNNTPFLISSLNLEKCLNLEIITISTEEDNLYEAIHKILQLPKLKKISFIECNMEYFVKNNSLVFPSVEEIYIGDNEKHHCNARCFKYVDDEINGAYYGYYNQVRKIYSYGLLDNVKAMLTQCPSLKICMLDGNKLL
jgi:hypothetical protein